MGEIINTLERKYLEVVCDFCDKPYAYFKYAVRWNVECIAKKGYSNGYIVQYVFNENTTNINGLSEQPYYEAWKVEDGVVIDTKKQPYDDIFSWGDGFERVQIENSIGKSGKVVYKTKIFWVDKTNPIYKQINQWKRGALMPCAGNLKATWAKDCDCFKNELIVFERYFEHIVNFASKEIIKEGLLNYKKDCKLSNNEWANWIKEILFETPYKTIIKNLLD